MCFHFQNVRMGTIFKGFAGARITKPLFYSMNMQPNWLAFLSLDGRSYKWRLPIDVQC